jgi:hypothetical protein
MDDKTTIKSAPIWPGPECLRERPARLVMRPTRGSYYPAAVLRLVDGGVWIDGHVYDGRHVMPGVAIALAWEAVRARRERWLAWCASRAACEMGLAYAAARMSPEQAMADAARSHDEIELLYTQFAPNRCRAPWGELVFDARWHDKERPREEPQLPAVIDRFLRSPEWAALPFNASEVGRG